jgi:putative SOS response-associated peptidase YedK
MCYSIAFIEKRAEKLAERYKHAAPQNWNTGELQALPLFYFVSVFEKPYLPVLTAQGWSLQQWGLIPFWVKDPTKASEIQKHTGNAKCETLFEKPSFRHTIKSQRCIIPVNGFFEWHTAGKKKLPYYIYPKIDSFFSLGGIYDSWNNPANGQTLHSFSIITTPANPLMAKIHNIAQRMPFIIPQQKEHQWLQEELSNTEIKNLMQPFEEEEMAVHRVSTFINNVRHNRNIPESILKVDAAD